MVWTMIQNDLTKIIAEKNDKYIYIPLSYVIASLYFQNDICGGTSRNGTCYTA